MISTLHVARLKAWGAHGFTATGVVLAFLATLALLENSPKACLLWLGLALVVDGVKKLLKQEQSATQLAEGAWKDIPLLLLFDWFCDWSSLILRYQLTQDENGLGLPDMRKVVQYLAQKSAQDKVLNIQDWILAQRQKVLGKANLNRVLLLEALLVQWVGLLGRR